MTPALKRRVSRVALALLALALLPGPAAAGACRTESFEASRYVVCSFELSRADLRMYWRDAEATPYRDFPALARALRRQGLHLAFAMNAGMYQTDHSPLGLYIENGETLVPANTATVTGSPAQIPNFYKKPNGVFLVAGGEAGIMATEAYLQAQPAADFATQSGPMLVIDGAIHPMFIPGSSDRRRRNGVGVSAPDRVHFVISAGRVNFHEFARLFRDRLGCDNALYLDGGSAPGLYAPGLGRSDPPGHGGYGPIIAVVEQLPAVPLPQ